MGNSKLAKAAKAFAGTVALDGVWAAYISTLASGSLYALAWSACTILVGGYVIRLYNKDGWLLWPAAAGAAVGTGLVMAL